jgi:5-methylcytosine-specific restriction endonuclease McrA
MPRRRNLSAFYRAYIQSSAWRVRANACLARAGYRCQRCGRPGAPSNPLHAHHLIYIRLGHELPCDLLCVCRSCHRFEDRQRRSLSKLQRKRFS